MKTNEYLNNQKQIFWDLLAATVMELDIYPDITKGEFTFGANGSAFSFRNCGKGFLSGVIARAVLPVTEDGQPDGHMSDQYPMEALLSADIFELHSFHNGEGTFVKYEKGERTELRVYSDYTTPPGLLIRLEWGQGLPDEHVLREKDVASAMRRIMSKDSPLPVVRWKPAVWFNGERVRY